MLHLETVEPGTFSILKKLMEVPALSQSALVGGTALSLRYGHRISIDLDLFFNEKFENTPIEEALKNEFGEKFDYKKTHEKFGIFCFIENVKVGIMDKIGCCFHQNRVEF